MSQEEIVRNFIENLNLSHYNILVGIYVKFYKNKLDSTDREERKKHNKYRKFIRGLSSEDRKINIIKSLLLELVCGPQKTEAIEYICALLCNPAINCAPISYPIEFSLNIVLPTHNVKLIVFVDRDQISKKFETKFLFGNSFIPVHLVYISNSYGICPTVYERHITRIYCPGVGKDTSDQAICMLLGIYLKSNPIPFYIWSNDHFAETVVATLNMNGKNITQTTDINLYLLMDLDVNFSAPASEFRHKLMVAIEKYKSYYFGEYFILKELGELPSFMDKITVLNTLASQLKYIPKQWPVIPELVKYRSLFTAPYISVKDVDCELEPKLRDIFLVDKFKLLLKIPLIQDYLGISVESRGNPRDLNSRKNENLAVSLVEQEWIYPKYDMIVGDELVTEAQLRTMVNVKSKRYSHSAADIIRDYNTNVQVYEKWLKGGKPTGKYSIINPSLLYLNE